MKVFKTDDMRVPVKSWATELDDITLKQITNATNIAICLYFNKVV